MNEIICPHCEKAFKIDEAGYADILKQIRNKEFDKELHEKLAAAEQEKKSALSLAEAENETKRLKLVAESAAEITDLKNKIDNFETQKQLSESELRRNLEFQIKDKDDEIALKKFTTYIEAYCAEMKATEHDILLNDELFESVYSIFHNIMTKALA